MCKRSFFTLSVSVCLVLTFMQSAFAQSQEEKQEPAETKPVASPQIPRFGVGWQYIYFRVCNPDPRCQDPGTYHDPDFGEYVIPPLPSGGEKYIGFGHGYNALFSYNLLRNLNTNNTGFVIDFDVKLGRYPDSKFVYAKNVDINYGSFGAKYGIKIKDKYGVFLRHGFGYSRMTFPNETITKFASDVDIVFEYYLSKRYAFRFDVGQKSVHSLPVGNEKVRAGGLQASGGIVFRF